MPKYRIQAPDGATYEIEGPEGASDLDVRREVLRQYPQASGGTQAPQASQPAQPTEQPSFFRRLATTPLDPSAVGRAVTPYVGQGLELLSKGVQYGAQIPPSEQATGWGQTVAESVIPQTPTQVLMLPGAAAGRAAAGALAPSSRMLAPAAGAVTGGTVAGAVGGYHQGGLQGAEEGALEGGIGAAVGEGLGYIGGKLLRSRAGAERQIAGKDLRNITAQMRRDVPVFANLPLNLDDPAVVANFAKSGKADQGRAILSQHAQATVDMINKRIGNQPVDIPTLGGPRTVDQAWLELSQLGRSGYGGASADPTKRTVAGLDAREAWRQGMDELQAAINKADPSGASGQLFDQTRRTYATGLAYLQLFGDPGVWTKGTTGTPMLNMRALQDKIGRQQGALERKMQGALDPLIEQATRGGGIQARDVNWQVPFAPNWLTRLTPGAGAGAAAGMGIGGIPGALVGAGVGSALLPNAARQYAGKVPFTMPPWVQTAVDYELYKLLSTQPPQ